MTNITTTPLEALAQLAAVASLIDTFECKDNGIYNRLQGALGVAQTVLAMAPKQEAMPEMTDDRIFEWAEGYVFTLKGMPHKMTFSRPRFVQAVRTIIAHLPASPAAPAAANGAPKDERAAFDQWSKPIPYVLFSDYAWQAWQARAILAAAGPDAAPKGLELAAEQLAEYCENMGYYNSYVDDVRAALSGAKGN